MKLIPRFNRLIKMVSERRGIIPRFSKYMYFRFYEARDNLKKISIFGLTTVLFVSAIMCCCFTDTVQAEEPTPLCHPTSHEKDSTKNKKDCNCDESFTIAKKDVAFNAPLVSGATFVIKLRTNIQNYVSPFAVAYQAPPQFYDTLPLSIKHSILRI